MKTPNDYSDIINSPRPTNHAKTPLSVEARAAQFSPYATLSGHKDIVNANEDLASHKINIDREITIEDVDD